jgi:N-acetylmuramoyl-L-alanine amidase
MIMIDLIRFRIILFSICSLLIFYSTATAGISPKTQFYQAESSYKKLLKNHNKQKYRKNWLNCIKKYKKVYKLNPSGPWAAAGMYKTGVLYAKLSLWSNKNSDTKEALNIFKRVVKKYPASRYKTKAANEIHRISGKNPVLSSKKVYHKKKKVGLINKKTAPSQKPQQVLAAKKIAPALFPKKFATVKDLRFWSNPNYTRIVIDADKETLYTHRLLKKDPSISKPQRLYVDLNRSRLGKTFKKTKQINDNLLKDARAGQYTSDTVRVVIDIKSFKNYKIFSLKNPFRIVIDVWGKAGKPIRYAKK